MPIINSASDDNMLSLALLPLAGYFTWLVFLNVRQRPAVVGGVRDFMLLACGLFGLATLGPGRLLIPMDVMSFWGFGIWAFWTAFYFAAAHLIARLLERRIVVYHCSVTDFVPKLFEISKELDPKTRLEGNVLFLPDYGIQCSLDANTFGGILVLTATSPLQNDLQWQHFEQNLAAKSTALRCSSKSALFVWSVFTAAAFAFMTFSVSKYAVWLETFLDYGG